MLETVHPLNLGIDSGDHYQQLAIGCYINLINKNT